MFKFYGLQLKLSIPIAIISTFILGIYGSFTYQNKKEKLTRELNSKVKRSLNKLGKNITQPYLDLEEITLNNILRSELKAEIFLLAIRVLNDKKEVEYSFGKSLKSGDVINNWTLPSNFDKKNLKIMAFKRLDRNKNLNKENEEIGFIEIFITKKYIDDELQKEAIKLFYIILLLDFFLFLSNFLLLHFLAIKPLNIIKNYSEKLGSNELSISNIRFNKSRFSHDELDDLAHSFNQMKNNLSLTQTALKNYTNGLEEKVIIRTKELNESLSSIKGMLSNIDKAVFRVDEKGQILPPVSQYSTKVFGQDIVGKNALKLLFFRLKDKSEEKEKLISSFKGIFGKDEKNYSKIKSGLITKVTSPDKIKKRGRTLEINYGPLYDENGLLERLMIIVDDVTETDLNEKELSEGFEKYYILSSILQFKNRSDLSENLSKGIYDCIDIFDKVTKYEIGSKKLNNQIILIKHLLINCEKNNLDCLPKAGQLISEIIWGLESLEMSSYQEKSEEVIINLLSKELFDFINCLILYADGFNKLKNYDIGCGLKYKNQNDIEKIIGDKVSDLQRIMTNLLEYVFLVRNFKDLDTKKIERAIGNARLYDQFDYTILLLRNRSRLIYFLLKTCNKISAADRYIELSNLLEQMPSKDMLTEAALINHLIEPYKKTL